jgi:hypothetical protein
LDPATLIVAADSHSFRVADLKRTGAKVQIAAPDRELLKLKEFRRIPLRADKTEASFSAIVQLAAALINSG